MLLVTVLLLLAAVLCFLAAVLGFRPAFNWLAAGLLCATLVPFIKACQNLF